MYKDGRPLGFPTQGYPAPQGPYYTGVGYSNVGAVAREIVEKHLDLCLFAGINHEGINAEVAKGQWEFQIFGKGSKKAADEMWMARYLLQRLTETYGIDIEYHCKPLGDTDWNGGMHANFSTKFMREVGGKAYFEALMAAFEKNLMDHIAVYGPGQRQAPDRQARDRALEQVQLMAWPTAAPRSACRTRSSRTTTRAISKTAARTRKATPTPSLADPEDRRRGSDPPRPARPPKSDFTART
jgi:Glutamine synthetase